MTKQDAKKSGTGLIVGGVLLLVIVAGGGYLASNPELISKWQYRMDSARKEEMQKILLIAPASCAGIDAAMFARACERLDETYDDAFDWSEGLSAQQRTCVEDSFRETTAFKLEFDGDPASHLENLTTDDGLMLHMCGINEEVKYADPDYRAQDARAAIDRWHQYRHGEGNYY